MLPDNLHLSDHDLVLFADGEATPAAKENVRSHLDACWSCRARLRELETTIAAYVTLHQTIDAALPPAAGPRALLRARLGEAVRSDAAYRSFPVPWRWSLAAGFLVVFLGGGLTFYLQQSRDAANAPVPSSRLTPGEVRTVAVSDVCRLPAESQARTIPVVLQQRVFREYGIPEAVPDSYEVDYLITPELGGADSIRNLWPQPYTAVWNAHVKDRLEDRLHNLVCEGKLDLPTAQREIATDWISAYKKYFATSRPN